MNIGICASNSVAPSTKELELWRRVGIPRQDCTSRFRVSRTEPQPATPPAPQLWAYLRKSRLSKPIIEPIALLNRLSSPSITVPKVSTPPIQPQQQYTMSSPRFFSQPFRYIRWASHENPAIFWSIVIGSIGPPMMVIVPPIRRYFGDGPREPIPLTYPSKPH